MRRFYVPVLMLFGLVWVSGCAAKADPEKALIGTYTGEMKLPPSKQDDAQAAMLKQLIGDIMLELRADHTYTMKLGQDVVGTWAYQPDRVVLTTKTIAGQDFEELKQQAIKSGQPVSEEQMSGKLDLMIESEGKVLHFAPSDKEQGELIFTSQTAPAPKKP